MPTCSVHNLLLRGARLIDGSSSPARVADVALDAGVIRRLGLSADLLQRLNRDINPTLALPAVKERYAALAWEIQASTAPDALIALARAETPRWANVVRRSGAQMN
jgi:hypothetical protein